MSELVEGVLSETMLDELASDLGIDPKDLRKHPFFRVIKGRVLLTYPLKTYSLYAEWLGLDTVYVYVADNDAAYVTVSDTTGSGILVGFGGTSAAANINCSVEITIDGVLIYDSFLFCYGLASQFVTLMKAFETSCLVRMKLSGVGDGRFSSVVGTN